MGFLAAAAPSLIGGIFSLFGQKKAEKREDTQLQRMVADAKAAGYNPKSVLDKMGGGSYNRASSQGSLTGASFLAEAVKNGFDSVFNKDRHKIQEEIERIELEKAKLELENIQNEKKSLARGFGFDIPSVVNNTGNDHVTNSSSPLLAEPVVESHDADPVSGVRRDGNGLSFGGNSVDGYDLVAPGFWRTNPYYPSAQHVEDGYGDVVSWGYGILKGTADAVATATYWGGKGIDALKDKSKKSKKSGPKRKSRNRHDYEFDGSFMP